MKRSIMYSTHPLSATDFGQAALISTLSGRPAHITDDLFAWNGKVVDRATAVVALLKIYNHVPVGDSIKINIYEKYHKRFSNYIDNDLFVSLRFTDKNTDRATLSRIWFNQLCSVIRGDVAELSSDNVKQILVTLHS